MLTDKQIRKAAEDRIAAMSAEELGALENEIEDGLRLTETVSQHGYKTLSKEERRRYHLFTRKMLDSSGGGGNLELAATETAVQRSLGVSREQIGAMERNPFTRSLWKTLLAAVLIGAGGNLLTALLVKHTGADLWYLYTIFSALAAGLLLRCAGIAVYAVRFRKLQKAYEQPEFQKGEIGAAVFRILQERVKKARSGK